MRNLLGRLLERSPDELERIARFWSIELRGRDRHTDVSTLYRSMTDVWTARDAWERLTPEAWQVIRVLREHDAAQTTAQVAEQTTIGGEATERELRALYDAGIVSIEADEGQPRSDPAWFLPREIGMILQRVDAERTADSPANLSLDALLATATYQEIEEAAVAWGARVIPAMHARGELVGVIREQLARPERVERYVNNLSGPARTAWTRLKTAGGTLSLDDLISPVDVPLAARRRILRELSIPLLLWHGCSDDDPPRRLAIVPRAVLEPAPRRSEPVPDLAAVDPADVVEPDWIFPWAGVWDLLTILREVTTGAPRWRALVEGDPALVRRLRRRLWSADRESLDIPTGYIGFLARLGGLIGVLRDDDDRAVPGDEAHAWREHAFSSAGQRMVAAWTAAEEWLEGRDRVDANLWGAAWPAFRKTLLRALGDLDEERWYDEARFIERLLRAEPDLLRQAQVVAITTRRERRAVVTAADAEERRSQILRLVIGTTLETACVWLGLIERSHARSTDAPALRVTPFGRWIAGRRIEPAAPQAGPAALAVGANFQVLLYRPTPRRVWALSSFAELQSLERISVWSLTSEALIRALAGGVDLGQVVAFLERASGTSLPPNVAATLAEWDRGYRRVWLRRAVVLAPEEGEESEPIVTALREAGLDPELLGDGRIVLIYDEPDAGERLYGAATRALRERGFAPLTDPNAPAARQRRER